MTWLGNQAHLFSFINSNGYDPKYEDDSLIVCQAFCQFVYVVWKTFFVENRYFCSLQKFMSILEYLEMYVCKYLF